MVTFASFSGLLDYRNFSPQAVFYKRTVAFALT